MYFFDPLTSNNISVSTREFFKGSQVRGNIFSKKKIETMKVIQTI